MKRPRRHRLSISAPDTLHPNTARLVLEFANALAAKLARAQEKYGYTTGWSDPSWEEECRQHMRESMWQHTARSCGGINGPPLTARRALAMTTRDEIIDILHRYRRGEAGLAEDAYAEIAALFAPDWTDRYTLPCDVRLPPATIVRKGCTMKTLIVGLIARESIGDAGTVGEKGSSDETAA